MARRDSPKSRATSGRPGPGEITMQSKSMRSITSQVAASLRTTTGAAPFTTAISWYRLKVNES
jgi:hypothetical protein